MWVVVDIHSYEHNFYISNYLYNTDLQETLLHESLDITLNDNDRVENTKLNMIVFRWKLNNISSLF